LPVGNGGTGLTTLTAGSVILGNGASAPTFVAPGTSGNVLTSNGTFWVYPGKPLNFNCIMVLPEKVDKLEQQTFQGINILGICSDYVLEIQNLL
jgi:hypothetical protein